MVEEYVGDTEGLTLTSAILDVNEGLLTLNFSDILNTSTLILGDIIIQNALSMPSEELVFEDGVVSRSADALSIEIELTEDELNTLKIKDKSSQF